MSHMVQLFAQSDFNLLLHLRFLQSILFPDLVCVDFEAKILQIIMLVPKLFVDALRPRLVIIVVTYHEELQFY